MDELTKPRNVKTQDTKNKIQKAATSILKKKGYDYFTVSNICKAAGVSNGTFFYHFKTKEELLTVYNYDEFAKFRKSNGFDQAVADQQWDEKIYTFYYYWCSYMKEAGLDFASHYYSTSNTALDVSRYNQRVPEYTWSFPVLCLNEGKEKGLLSSEHGVRHYHECLASITKGVCFDWCVSEGARDPLKYLPEVMWPYLKSIAVGND